MKEYARLYHLYDSAIAKILRELILTGLLILLFLTKSNIYLVLLSCLMIFELFFKFKISRHKPPFEIKNNNGTNILDSFTIQALSTAGSGGIKATIHNLLKTEPVRFILDKADILNPSEIKIVDIPKEEVLNHAFKNVKNLGGKYVTQADIFASYLLLTEGYTKLLFGKNLKEEEILQILVWARGRFSAEEEPKPFKIHFGSQGIAEDWATGWTIETKKYMIDISSEAVNKKPIAQGRESELKQLIEALYKGKGALLVGEAGSGRKEIVKALAYESFSGNLKGNLYHQKFYQLLVDMLMAGTSNLGDMEKRLDDLIIEISHSGNTIIFLPNFENIMGSSTFHLDLSGLIIPYMEKGVVRIIGTITEGAYKKFVEPNKTLLSSLEIIKVDEPHEDEALKMLFKKSEELENSKTKISYKAVMACLKYSKKYLPDMVLPGSSITLLKDSIASANMKAKPILEEQDVLDKIEEKTSISVGTPGKEEKQVLLNLEEEIHKRVIDQKEGVTAISEALRRRRTGLSEENRPISFLFLGPTGVGKTETAKALSRLYFGGEKEMIRLDMSEYSGDDASKRLLGSLPGEGDAPGELTDKIYRDPFSLVLLDEFEKANPQILNLFLQIFEDGRLTDNHGRTVSFVDSIIIATSNAGSEFIREEIGKGQSVDKNFQTRLLELLQKQAVFKPELLNRFDGIIVFKPLSQDDIKQVTRILLEDVRNKLKQQDITVEFDESVIEKIIAEGFDQQFGARPTRRYIQDNIEDMIAQKLLKEEIKRGDKIQFTVSSPRGGAGSSQLTVTVNNQVFV